MPAAVAMPLIGMAVSAGTSGIQMAQANKQKRETQNAIDNYQRQTLTNPYNSLQVSTLGADRQREDLARTLATYGGMAAMGGSRSIAATLPNLLEQQNAQEAQIAANLDQQQAQINQLQGQGEFGIMKMREDRETADLAGLGTQLDLANAQSASARGVVNGLTNVASAGLASMADGKTFFGQTKWGPPTAVPMGASAGLQGVGIDLNKYLQNGIQLPTTPPYLKF